MSVQHDLSRREVLAAAGLLGGLAVLGELPLDALAAGDTTDDALSGLVAFVAPGPDRYSKAQRRTSRSRLGVSSGVVADVKECLAVLGPTIPAGAAALLNNAALTVRPGAANGAFAAPFANLRWREKAQVIVDADEARSATLTGLPSLAALLVFGEAAAVDVPGRRPSRTPPAWKATGFGGPADGHAELRGYWQGRKEVRPDA